MRKLQATFIIVAILLLMLITPNTSIAQGLNEEESYEQSDNSNPGDGDDTNDNVPIDGGLTLLLAAGVAYGAKKAVDKKREEK